METTPGSEAAARAWGMASTNLGTGLSNYRIGHPALGSIAYLGHQPVDG